MDKNSTRFHLVHGTNDDVVDSVTQSTAFLTALKQAQFIARTIGFDIDAPLWWAVRLGAIVDDRGWQKSGVQHREFSPQGVDCRLQQLGDARDRQHLVEQLVESRH